MTSLAAWIGADTRGTASLYLATDSRISWGSDGTWDFGSKAFASSRLPLVFGHAGVLLFPSLILSQFVTALDVGAYDPSTFDAMLRNLVAVVRETHESLIAREKGAFEIIVGGRDGERLSSRFRAARLTWDGASTYGVAELSIPQRSDLLVSTGSGGAAVRATLAESHGTPSHGTSRAVFTAFTQSLNAELDHRSGGAPQLVGIYRVGAARTFGIVNGQQRFIRGLPVKSTVVSRTLEWRNELFERCDGRTGTRLPSAQPHV